MTAFGLIFALTACGTSAPASAPGLRRVVGTELVSARGATLTDQRKIDRTVVGICAADVWTRDECARHGASAP
ncbi:hypothetical protein [Pseudorhizobium tarimense]|uniref:hypothetical protein n=1 Tax=Pseudorhizobium tarimense TaxID=1079109 RepID=UPI001FF4AD0D|nr:hypothetical protein [Pseudorhizobium tarimense]MCJ8520489.1 hypothetical protein [Pseudorhizobium tarimense]